MPSPSPVAPISIAINAMATLVSNLGYFQFLTGAGSASAALANIFVGEVGFAVGTVTIAGGYITIATRRQHNIAQGQSIEISGASLGAESGVDITGSYTVSSVTTTGIVVPTSHSAVASFAPVEAFVLPCTRPIVVISETDGDGYHSSSIGTGTAFVQGGTLELLVEADVSQSYQQDPTGALTEARNTLGYLVLEMQQIQSTIVGDVDMMCLNDVDAQKSIEFTSDSEQDSAVLRYERWRGIIKATWGLNG